jgi:hypothetical protein
LDVAQQRGPVRVRLVDAGASQVLQLAVDFEKAEIPDRAYFSDYTEVVRARSGFSFFFGKLIPQQSALRTKVEISFPRESFMQQLWASSRKFHETVRATVAKMPPIEAITNVEETDKVQTFRSNCVFMAVLGEEALMDFYYIPPSDIHYVRTGQRHSVNLQAVIRISLATPILYGFLQQCGAEIERDPSLEAILEAQDVL